MEVSELLNNDAVKEALGADGVTAINALLSSATETASKLKEAEGKIGGITEQKKKAQSQLTELSERMEALETAKLSKAEQIEREKTKTAELLAQRETELKEMRETMATKDRSVKLANIAGDLHFLKDVPSSTQSLLLENAFKDVDLNSPDMVNAVLTQFKDGHKPFLQAENAASGTGTKSAGSSDFVGKEELTPEAIRNMKPEDFMKNSEKLWVQAGKEATTEVA